MNGSPGDHAVACQCLSDKRTGHTCVRNKFPGSDIQGLVGDVAGMFQAGVQRMKGTEEAGNLSVGKWSLVAV